MTAGVRTSRTPGTQSAAMLLPVIPPTVPNKTAPDGGPDDEPGPFGREIAVLDRTEVNRDTRLRRQGDRGSSRRHDHRQQEDPGYDQRRHHWPRLSPEPKFGRDP